MTATEWAMANKVKTGLGVVAALVTLMGTGFTVKSWAEDQATDKIAEQALIQQGREEAAHSVIASTHQYDFADLRGAQAESELIDLEQAVAEGETLTPTQERKMRRLEKDVETFEEQKEAALDKLQEHEDDEHETE